MTSRVALLVTYCRGIWSTSTILTSSRCAPRATATSTALRLASSTTFLSSRFARTSTMSISPATLAMAAPTALAESWCGGLMHAETPSKVSIWMTEPPPTRSSVTGRSETFMSSTARSSIFFICALAAATSEDGRCWTLLRSPISAVSDATTISVAVNTSPPNTIA